MGYSPWGRKELDVAERLTLWNYRGSNRPTEREPANSLSQGMNPESLPTNPGS